MGAQAVAQIRSPGVIGGAFLPAFEDVSSQFSPPVINTIFMIGDVVNFFKFSALKEGWKTGPCIPMFDIFNGLAGLAGGSIMTSQGLKDWRAASKEGDGVGKRDAFFVMVAGVSWVALSIFKLGYAALGMAVFLGVTVPVVGSLIALFGLANGVCTLVMFAAYVVRSVMCEIEMWRFRDQFKAVLEKVVWPQDSSEKLPEGMSPKELYDEALWNSMEDEEAFAAKVVGALRENLEQKPFELLMKRVTKEACVEEVRHATPEGAKVVLDHLFAKWTERKNWNRALGAVSLVAMGILTFLMLANPGMMMTIALSCVIGLFVVFALVFDGPSLKASLSEKTAGVWDRRMFEVATAVLLTLIVCAVALTAATGGLPLVYALGVGGLLLALHVMALAWVAKRTAEAQKQGLVHVV